MLEKALYWDCNIFNVKRSTTLLRSFCPNNCRHSKINIQKYSSIEIVIRRNLLLKFKSKLRINEMTCCLDEHIMFVIIVQKFLVGYTNNVVVLYVWPACGLLFVIRDDNYCDVLVKCSLIFVFWLIYANLFYYRHFKEMSSTVN